jgi:hypothetical protein
MERHEELSTADFANPPPREARESDQADQADRIDEERRDDYPRDREPGEHARDPVETGDRIPEPTGPTSRTASSTRRARRSRRPTAWWPS